LGRKHDAELEVGLVGSGDRLFGDIRPGRRLWGVPQRWLSGAV